MEASTKIEDEQSNVVSYGSTMDLLESPTPPPTITGTESVARAEQMVHPCACFVPQWRLVNNADSFARDMLASERTFLAWVRTGLAIFSIGFAIVKLVQEHSHPRLVKGLGTFLIVSGVGCIVYAWLKNMVIAHQLCHKQFLVDSIGPLLVVCFSVIVGALALATIYL